MNVSGVSAQPEGLFLACYIWKGCEMSLVQCGVGTGEKTGSFAVKAKGNAAVVLAGLWSFHCINIFKQTELLES